MTSTQPVYCMAEVDGADDFEPCQGRAARRVAVIFGTPPDGHVLIEPWLCEAHAELWSSEIYTWRHRPWWLPKFTERFLRGIPPGCVYVED